MPYLELGYTAALLGKFYDPFSRARPLLHAQAVIRITIGWNHARRAPVDSESPLRRSENWLPAPRASARFNLGD